MPEPANYWPMVRAAAHVGLGVPYARGEGAGTTNCSRLVLATLREAYGGDWSPTVDRAIVLARQGDRWPDVAAYRSAGLTDALTWGLVPGRWHVAQGWRANNTGHAWLWWEPSGAATGEGYVIEATDAARQWARWDYEGWWRAGNPGSEVRYLALAELP